MLDDERDWADQQLDSPEFRKAMQEESARNFSRAEKLEVELEQARVSLRAAQEVLAEERRLRARDDACRREAEAALRAETRDFVDRAADALIWCGGSEDFAPGGRAHEGWKRLVRPLLKELLAFERVA